MAKRTSKNKKRKAPARTFINIQEQKIPKKSLSVDVMAQKSSYFMSGMKIKRSYVITALAIIIVIILWYIFKNQFIVATVNGEPISRMSFNQQLEKQSGRTVLNSLITKTLILQEANKEHATVNDQEIDNEMKKIQSDLAKQGQNLDQALAARGTSQNDLREQIKIQKLIEKMVGKNIKVTDKEIDDYIAKNTPPDTGNGTTNSSQLPSRDAIKQLLYNDKLRAKFTPWLQKLQDSAKINYFVKF